MSEPIKNHELMDVFYQETQNLIDEMKKDLSVLSQGGETRAEEQTERSSVLNRLFRDAHIVKSSSASVGFDDLGKLTQSLEKIFKTASHQRQALTSEVISLLSESVRVCQKLLNEEEVVGYKELLERLNGALHPWGGQ